MLCPKNPNRDFDDMMCRDCNWFMQCFKMWQDSNIWGKESPPGDNFPIQNTSQPLMDFLCKYYHTKDCVFDCRKCKYHKSKKETKPITQEELEKFRIELGEIIFFNDWERRIDAN